MSSISPSAHFSSSPTSACSMTKHICYAVKVTKALRVTIAMKSFAGDTNKRMQLVGTAPWLHTLHEVSHTLWPTVQKQQQKAKSLVTVHKGKFTGKSKELKASAAYTQQFGEAVALCAAGVSAAGVVQQLRGAAQHTSKRALQQGTKKAFLQYSFM